MGTRSITSLILSFLLYLILQIFLFNSWYMILFNYGFCFVYLATILLLPFETSLITLLLVAFGVGFVVDNFTNTLGMHTAASVLMAYARPLIIRLLMPQRGYEERLSLNLKSMGPQWFISYIGLCLLVHHTLLFTLEASSWSLILPGMLKIILSIFYTGFVIFIIQYFLSPKRTEIS